jgi:CP family cyanate transporter-like MFS transporter
MGTAVRKRSLSWINRSSSPWLVLAWLTAFSARAPLVAQGPLLPLIMRQLGLSGTLSGLLTGLPLLVMAAVSLPAGHLGDRIGPRRVLVLAELGVALATLGRAESGNAAMLLGTTAVLGAAIGLSQPALAQVAQRVGGRHADAATALYSTGLMIGSIAATVLSVPSLLPLTHSWRAVLLLWGIPPALAAGAWPLLRDPAAAVPPEPKPRAARGPLASLPGQAPLVATFAAQSAIFYALVTWLPDFYTSHGWSLRAASGPVVLLSLGSLGGSLATPLLLRRFGGLRRPMLAAGFAAAAGLAGLLLEPDWGLAWAGLTGAATALAFSLALAAPALYAPPGETGRVAGSIMAAGYGLTLVGPLSVGTLVDATGGFGWGLGLLLVLAAVIILGALRLPKPHLLRSPS